MEMARSTTAEDQAKMLVQLFQERGAIESMLPTRQ
jgi:hypothetical protein